MTQLGPILHWGLPYGLMVRISGLHPDIWDIPAGGGQCKYIRHHEFLGRGYFFNLINFVLINYNGHYPPFWFIAYLFIDTKANWDYISLNYMFSYKGVLLFMIKKKLFLSTLTLKNDYV